MAYTSPITVDDFQDYEYHETGLLFDRKLKEVYGREEAPGGVHRVRELTAEEVKICSLRGFTYSWRKRGSIDLNIRTIGHCIICYGLSVGWWDSMMYRNNWIDCCGIKSIGILISPAATGTQGLGATRHPICELCAKLINLDEKGLVNGLLLPCSSVKSFRHYFDSQLQLSEQILVSKKQIADLSKEAEKNNLGVKFLRIVIEEEEEKRIGSENRLIQERMEFERRLSEQTIVSKKRIADLYIEVGNKKLDIKFLQEKIILEHQASEERMEFQGRENHEEIQHLKEMRKLERMAANYEKWFSYFLIVCFIYINYY